MKKFETKLLAEGFSLIDKTLGIFEQQDPNVEHCTKVANQINDAIQCYHIYGEKERKTIQLSLDCFFWPITSTSKEAAPQPSTSSFIEEQQEEEESPQYVSDDDDDGADDPLLML